MLYFDFALMTIVAAGAVALVIAMIALATGFLRRPSLAPIDEDGRDTAMIRYGEGTRDCK